MDIESSGSQELIAGFGIAFFERRIVAVMIAYSIVYDVLFVLNNVLVFEVYWEKTLVYIFMTAPPYAVVFSIIALVLRRLAVWRSWRTVLADKRRYDTMWEHITSQEGASVWLSAIQAEVHELLRIAYIAFMAPAGSTVTPNVGFRRRMS